MRSAWEDSRSSNEKDNQRKLFCLSIGEDFPGIIIGLRRVYRYTSYKNIEDNMTDDLKKNVSLEHGSTLSRCFGSGLPALLENTE